MELNVDCIRDILIIVESIGYEECLSFNDFYNKINQSKEKNNPQYKKDELQYHCLKLYEAGYLDLVLNRQLTEPIEDSFKFKTDLEYRKNVLCEPDKVSYIKDLTYNGHKFLSNIRENNNWNKTKKIAKSVGSYSLDVLGQIASSVITSLIQANIGL